MQRGDLWWVEFDPCCWQRDTQDSPCRDREQRCCQPAPGTGGGRSRDQQHKAAVSRRSHGHAGRTKQQSHGRSDHGRRQNQAQKPDWNVVRDRHAGRRECDQGPSGATALIRPITDKRNANAMGAVVRYALGLNKLPLDQRADGRIEGAGRNAAAVTMRPAGTRPTERAMNMAPASELLQTRIDGATRTQAAQVFAARGPAPVRRGVPDATQVGHQGQLPFDPLDPERRQTPSPARPCGTPGPARSPARRYRKTSQRS